MKLTLCGKLIETLCDEQDENLEGSFCITDTDIPPLLKIFNFLNNKDKDILLLIFMGNKTQTDLVKILNRSQPSLSYDIKRIKKRIKFIVYIHSMFKRFTKWLEEVAELQVLTEEEVMVFTLIYFTSSFSQSNLVCKLKPTRIRYVFDRALTKIETIDAEIYNMFVFIRNNLNTIKRTYQK